MITLLTLGFFRHQARASWAMLQPSSPASGVNCFTFLLTTTGAEDDWYHMDAESLLPLTWVAAVQVVGVVTYPYPAVHLLAGGESDTLCAEFTPLHDGVGSYDFVIHSASDPGEVDSFHLTLYAGEAAVGAGGSAVLPATGGLHSNYPNPFARETQFHYDLVQPSNVDLRIYDVSGRLVRALEGGVKEAGRHTARWDGVDELGRPAPSGAYFYHLTAGNTRSARRMVLLR